VSYGSHASAEFVLTLPPEVPAASLPPAISPPLAPVVTANPVKSPPEDAAPSPFSRALLRALRDSKSTSYADWVRRAGEMLPEDMPGRFVLQGPAERPLLTPSVRDDTLRLLLSDYHRRRHNLELAIRVLTDNIAVLQSPLDDLTRGVLSVHLARLLQDTQP